MTKHFLKNRCGFLEQFTFKGNATLLLMISCFLIYIVISTPGEVIIDYDELALKVSRGILSATGNV